jgi:hypothetical protein
MARIFTTPEAEQTAKAYLHDLTLAGGLRTNNQRPFSQTFRTDFVQHATAVCEELMNREFNNIDADLRWLAGFRFHAKLDGTGGYKTYKADGIAKCVVYMAELLSLYWDDTIRTPYEVEEFKKTLLGQAVYKYGRYISAIKDKPGKSRKGVSAGPAVANATGGTGVAIQATAKQPQNGYKQSGPQSGNVRDLQDLSGGVGTPGNKVFTQNPYMFRIVGDKTGSNTPNVFIKPLSSSGAAGKTNKIFFSSGNGYTDCTCLFEDEIEAQDFLQKIINAGRIPANVTNPHVTKLKPDSNGYFLVGTEFGQCAISAKTLNEKLTEAEANSHADWEKATEGYSKEELEELHTWMRRG